jgi:hypothetical protein
MRALQDRESSSSFTEITDCLLHVIQSCLALARSAVTSRTAQQIGELLIGQQRVLNLSQLGVTTKPLDSVVQPPKKKLTESTVQGQWNTELCQANYLGALTCTDTSQMGVTPESRPDLVLCHGGLCGYSTVVSVIELKANLGLTLEHGKLMLGPNGKSALGQVVQRFTSLLLAQPDRRSLMFLIGDTDHVVIGRLLVPDTEQLQAYHTRYWLELAPHCYSFDQRMFNTRSLLSGMLQAWLIVVGAICSWADFGPAMPCTPIEKLWLSTSDGV